MYIIIDGGGTSSKAYISDGKQIIKTHSFGPGNLTANYEGAKDNYLQFLNVQSGDYPDAKVTIFASGYLNLAADKKIELDRFFKENVKQTIQFKSDSELPLYAAKGTVVALTFGTGTAITYNTEGRLQNALGFGHLIKDPMSGYSLAQKIIFDVLTKGTDEQISELLSYYKVVNINGLINLVYSSPDKRIISGPFVQLYRSEKLKAFVQEAMGVQMKEIMETRNVLSACSKADAIVLNGSIANLIEVKELIKKYISTATFVSTEDRNQFILNVLNNLSLN